MTSGISFGGVGHLACVQCGLKKQEKKKERKGREVYEIFLYFSCLVIVLFFFFPLQHWIRIELYPDLLIQRLTMTVDPSDSSYMPSVVVVSAGDSIQSLKEVKTVHISATESLCTLLEDVQRVCYASFSLDLSVILSDTSSSMSIVRS